MSMVTKKSVMCVTWLALAMVAARAEAGQIAPRARVLTAVQAPQTPPPAAPALPALAPQPPVPPPAEPFIFAMPQLPALAPMPAIPPVEPFVFTMPQIPPVALPSDLARITTMVNDPSWKESMRALEESMRGLEESMRGFEVSAPMRLARAMAGGEQSSYDETYREARELIDESKYDKALEKLSRLVSLTMKERADAALYWKAYVLGKEGQRAEALAAIADMQKRFGDSRWLKDARALEVEIRQSSGQNPSPEAQNDEELKLLALRGLMQSDPERALPMIEKLLSGTSSPKVKDNALFVLSQSRSSKGREILASVAKNGNPDLQLRAIRYLGAMGIAENRQVLDDIYRSSNDPSVKRAILRGFMSAGDRTRLLGLAKSEKDESLRSEAIRQLGSMRASAELAELYQSEQSPEVKKQIINGLFVGGHYDKLIDLAKSERDPELRRSAIRQLGLMRRPETSEALTSIYSSDSNVDVRKAVVNALFLQNNAAGLVTLARAEKNPEMRKEIVGKLSLMTKSKEAQDYLLEILSK